MESDKSIYADQYNIPWQILDKRSQMITAFSNYSMRLSRYKTIDVENKNIVVACIIYLFSELNSLRLNKITNIKSDNKTIISYDSALQIYNDHIDNCTNWRHEDIKKLFYFTLEMCRVSGISDIGYTKIDYTKINAVRGRNGQVFE